MGSNIIYISELSGPVIDSVNVSDQERGVEDGRGGGWRERERERERERM